MRRSFYFVRKALQIKFSRFVIAISGIAISVLLVLSLASALHSASQVFTNYITQPGADLWVAPRGTDNLVRSSSVMPISYRKKLLDVPGVANADAVLKSFVVVTPIADSVESNDRLTLLGIVYMTPEGLGGPPLFAAGRQPTKKGEIALDEAAAMKLGVKINDKVSVDGKSKVVTGLTRGTNLIVTQFTFSSYDDLDQPSPYKELASFFIVRIEEGYNHGEVANKIRNILPDINVYEQKDFIENNRREIAAGYITILTLAYILGITAAAVLVALIIYGIVGEKRTEMAVLLALGVPESWLWTSLGWESIRLALVGSIVGTLIAFVFRHVLESFYPVLPLSFVFIDVVKLMTLLSVSGLAAATVPILSLRKIDPLEAFHS